MRSSESVDLIVPALINFSRDCPKIQKSKKNAFLKSSYADLEDILETINPILLKHKLCVVQPIGKEGVTTRISHESGQFFEDTCQIDIDQKKGISLNQAFGVAVTYTRRYSLGSMLSLTISDDTDGALPDVEDEPSRTVATCEKSPVGEPMITQKQIDLLEKLIKSHVVTDNERKKIRDNMGNLTRADAAARTDEMLILVNKRKAKEAKDKEKLERDLEEAKAAAVRSGIFDKSEVDLDEIN